MPSGNAINPGLYPSEMTAGSVSSLEKYVPPEGHANEFSDAHQMPPDRSPAERTGSEQDIAGEHVSISYYGSEYGSFSNIVEGTILFMASRAGAYLNGETLITDGGRMSQLPASY